MAGDDPKQRSVVASGTGTSGQANSEENVGLDRTHPPEAGIQHLTPSPNLEPAGGEEERPASQQGTNWTGAARTAQKRVRWRRAVDGLCSIRSDRLK